MIENNFGFINLDNIYQEMLKRVSDYRVKMEDFSVVYGPEQVERDVMMVKKFRANNEEKNTQQEKESQKLATIFEGILCEHAELSEWLGEDVTTIICSEYDDFINKVDLIAEFSEDNGNPSHLGLGVDATYSADLHKKFQDIKEKLAKGELSTIKYFQSSELDFMGQLSQIPRVIVGAKNETIKELIELQRAKKNKEIGQHWIQFQILEQIHMQLDEFEEYAKRIGENMTMIKISKMKRKIEQIYEKRNQAVIDSGKRDGFSEIIKKQLTIFEK